MKRIIIAISIYLVTISPLFADEPTRPTIVPMVASFLLNSDSQWNNECDNGKIDLGEVCDGTNFNGKTCDDYNNAKQGYLVCFSNCTVIEPHCSTCGDGKIEENEQCEEDNLNGYTCSSFPAQGYTGGGTVTCGDDCKVDKSNCTTLCGNGHLDIGEECDFGDRISGDGCSSECDIEYNVCGNGIKESGEQCDRSVPDGVTCRSIADGGLPDGTVGGCNSDCTIDFSDCCGYWMCDSTGHTSIVSTCGDPAVQSGAWFGYRSCYFGGQTGSGFCYTDGPQGVSWTAASEQCSEYTQSLNEAINSNF